jgi:GNAT superfamily N-acetyltransferase
MYSIRTALPADLVSVASMIDEAFSVYTPRIGRPPGPMFDNHAESIAAGNCYVAEDEAGIAGTIVVTLDAEPAQFDNVAVTARARGTGLGRQLIARAEALARAAGRAEIILYTNLMMTENLTLYPHLGYSETRRVSEKGYQRVYFAKRLSPPP